MTLEDQKKTQTRMKTEHAHNNPTRTPTRRRYDPILSQRAHTLFTTPFYAPQCTFRSADLTPSDRHYPYRDRLFEHCPLPLMCCCFLRFFVVGVLVGFLSFDCAARESSDDPSPPHTSQLQVGTTSSPVPLCLCAAMRVFFRMISLPLHG